MPQRGGAAAEYDDIDARPRNCDRQACSASLGGTGVTQRRCDWPCADPRVLGKHGMAWRVGAGSNDGMYRALTDNPYRAAA